MAVVEVIKGPIALVIIRTPLPSSSRESVVALKGPRRPTLSPR
jgi:hypothetical protein